MLYFPYMYSAVMNICRVAPGYYCLLLIIAVSFYLFCVRMRVFSDNNKYCRC